MCSMIGYSLMLDIVADEQAPTKSRKQVNYAVLDINIWESWVSVLVAPPPIVCVGPNFVELV